ncbi:hypothetical protein ACUY2R_11575, partial [Corynebacterium mastitidis]
LPTPRRPPASVTTRRRYLLAAQASLGLTVAAIPLLFISLAPSMILWTIGMGGYTGCTAVLTRATGRQSQARTSMTSTNTNKSASCARRPARCIPSSAACWG